MIRPALLFLLLAGCSTVQSRRDHPPALQQTTATSLQAFQGCLAERTAGQDAQYLPRVNGGTLSAGAGPQHYVSWVVDIDDLGTQRRVTLYAVGPSGKIADEVRACL